MGMGFKEILFQDIQNTFLDPEEFAEKHKVNGREMDVIVDQMEVTERGKKNFGHGMTDGAYSRQLLIYVSRKQFGRLPANGARLVLDSTPYRVQDAVNEGGVYSIILEAVVS